MNLFLLLLAVGLAGCTTGRTGGTPSGPGNAASAPLRMGMLAQPTTLDPAKTTDVYTSDLLQQSFEGLTRYNDKNQIEPALAEKWAVSPDGKVYTFTLRQGVTFHNGQVLTAADVKYSWERALAKKTASTVAANYIEGVVGVPEVVAGKRPDLAGVEAVDVRTLKVTLDRPRAYFPGMLTYPSNYVVCKEATAKNGDLVDEKGFVGTGPFALESYSPGDRIAFKAYERYWGGKPKAERLEYRIIVDTDTAYNAFQTGGLDVLETNTKRYAQDRESGKLSAEYHVVPVAQVNYLAMHTPAQPEFGKIEVRKAIAMAVDRAQVAKIAYKGVCNVAHGFVPPALADAGAEPPPIPYDPTQARQLLAKAGYPDGKNFPALTLTVVQQNQESIAAAQLVAANLKDNLNIQVNVQERELGQCLDDQEKGKLAFYILAWVADYLDPQDFLSTLFVSNASLNRYAYRNAQFDAFCRQADAESDHAKRAQLYSQANKTLMEDVGVLPLNYAPRIYLVQKNVQNWRANLCLPLPLAQVSR